MNRTKKRPSGCLWIFIFGILSVMAYTLINAFIGQSFWWSLILSLAFGFGLTSRWLGSPGFKGVLGNVFAIFLILTVLRLAAIFFVDVFRVEPTTSRFNKEEGVQKINAWIDNDSITVFSSNRVWKDNYGRDYAATLQVRESDYHRLKNRIDQFEHTDQGDFWGMLYQYVDWNDRPSLDLVMDAFEELHQQKQLNQMEFAEMVVSCVQDIPYSLVFQQACRAPQLYERSIREILEECPDCCIGNIKYGLQNPVSFLQNLKGDCDTRTVLIYSILKHFDYDVAILNSNYYRHSIIGLNIPAPGLHKTHFGKKYMVWETTGKYFRIGELPNSYNEIGYWEVVLTSK